MACGSGIASEHSYTHPTSSVMSTVTKNCAEAADISIRTIEMG
jgi:hypothetical protein